MKGRFAGHPKKCLVNTIHRVNHFSFLIFFLWSRKGSWQIHVNPHLCCLNSNISWWNHGEILKNHGETMVKSLTNHCEIVVNFPKIHGEITLNPQISWWNPLNPTAAAGAEWGEWLGPLRLARSGQSGSSPGAIWWDFSWFLANFGYFLMIYGDVLWFIAIYGDFWWFLVIVDDFLWFLAIVGDFGWFMVMFGDCLAIFGVFWIVGWFMVILWWFHPEKMEV